MANVHDYLLWRGDLTFAERPFNDVDNLILSALVYLDFSGIVPGEERGGGVRLANACAGLLAKAKGDVAPYVRSLAHIDARLVELVAGSRRFGDAVLSAYEDMVDESRSLQFCAMQVSLPDAGVYVAYRGTDDTLVGWRENFMLSFEVTEAQRESARYLERALIRLGDAGVPVRVGGHSKGGNLAEYAAVHCPEHLRRQVACVYSNDGPCMAPEVQPAGGREVLGTRLRRFVPSYSVVGMLFAQDDDPHTIVASSGVGIGQHDLTTWQVMRGGVQEALALQEDCVRLNQVIASWLQPITLEERKRVTNEVFDALAAGGATRLDQIAATPEGLQRVLRGLSATNGETHDLAFSFVQGAMGSSMNAMRKAAQRAGEEAVGHLLGPKDIRVRLSRRGRPTSVREVPRLGS